MYTKNICCRRNGVDTDYRNYDIAFQIHWRHIAPMEIHCVVLGCPSNIQIKKYTNRGYNSLDKPSQINNDVRAFKYGDRASSIFLRYLRVNFEMLNNSYILLSKIVTQSEAV